MAETVLFVERWQPNYAKISSCRICHEEEFESCRVLESPCSCSGTLKFAHRECIQRWCDEKGDTTCEICLQKYESGYTATLKKSKVIEDEVVTIRESLEITRRRQELRNTEIEAIAEDSLLESEYSDCSSAARTASCCRRIAFILTVLLLVRHLLAVVTGGAEHYPFSLLTVLIFRVCGIIIPMYVIMRVISALQDSIQRHHHHVQDSIEQNLQFNGIHEEQQQLQHTIDIQSHWRPS